MHLYQKEHFRWLKNSLQEFMQADCLNLAASLSYYTVFSLVPMLIIIIAISSFFLGQDAVTGALFGQIRGLVGIDAAEALQTMIANAYHPKSSLIATALGLGTLIFAATGVFTQLQTSLNKIWGVKPKPNEKRRWLKQIQKRFLSLGLLLALAFLLLVSLAVSAALTAFWGYVSNIGSGFSAILFKILEISVSIALTSILFALIFKFLPDARVSWKNVWGGGAITASLFEIGKNLIGLYLGRSNIASTYGGAGAIVVIMLWVNYSALIFFFGASFTKAYTLLKDDCVLPEHYAEHDTETLSHQAA